MKKRSLLFGAIFMILGLVAQGQIVVKYQQGFESTGETCSYTTSGSAAPQTSFASSGNRALKLSHTQNNQSISREWDNC